MTTRLGMRAFVRTAVLLGVAAASLLGTAAAASASGTMLIQRAGDHPSTYDSVDIQLIHSTLNVTSADGKGTLIVTRAACAYQGQLFVCLPTGVTLVQDGTHALDLRKGTIYANMTGAAQQLPLSSTQLPPNGVLMTLVTEKGTYINLTGTIDKVTK